MWGVGGVRVDAKRARKTLRVLVAGGREIRC